ncbi:hypothetical protein [Xanthomonas sp. 3498]|uniref:hypothetical protein n=1 Tax=Xanthomonas sp. 3498 TaxID=2663863 RepID=UPI001619CBB0|nr:hypothetical protein [Xanthomonas sp. 3498]MBB5875909.1 hypothetical protein [Xanthomonas sp. 3498]
MPSRSAHRAALRRALEPSVIPPEGVALPSLPDNMNWLNPVIGNDHDRDIWNLIRILPGHAETVASIKRRGAPSGFGVLIVKGDQEPARTLPLALAFEAAAEWAAGTPRSG